MIEGEGVEGARRRRLRASQTVIRGGRARGAFLQRIVEIVPCVAQAQRRLRCNAIGARETGGLQTPYSEKSIFGAGGARLGDEGPVVACVGIKRCGPRRSKAVWVDVGAGLVHVDSGRSRGGGRGIVCVAWA